MQRTTKFFYDYLVPFRFFYRWLLYINMGLSVIFAKFNLRHLTLFLLCLYLFCTLYIINNRKEYNCFFCFVIGRHILKKKYNYFRISINKIHQNAVFFRLFGFVSFSLFTFWFQFLFLIISTSF